MDCGKGQTGWELLDRERTESRRSNRNDMGSGDLFGARLGALSLEVGDRGR